MLSNLQVEIYEGGGTVRTAKLDFVTASQLVRAAHLRGVAAAIGIWGKSTTALWERQLRAGEATVAEIPVLVGECACTLRPGGGSVFALIPLGLPVLLASGFTVQFDKAIPPGTVGLAEDPYFAPPNLQHGQATEEPDA